MVVLYCRGEIPPSRFGTANYNTKCLYGLFLFVRLLIVGVAENGIRGCGQANTDRIVREFQSSRSWQNPSDHL